jgi:hypothetical protein
MNNDAIINTLVARVRTLEDEREQACEDLGANDRDSLRNAAQRVVRERDDARAELAFMRAEYGDSEPGDMTADALMLQSRILRRDRDEARRALGEILAVIHRDGGHHTGEHGITQSVADAHATWAAMVQERDGARDDAERIRRKAIAAQSERDHALVEFMLLQTRFREVERERDEARTEVERLRSLIGSSTRDDEAHELRRVLTGTVNDAIIAQKAKTATMLAEHGRSSMQHRNAIKRLDELRDAHNKLQSLQVDYSHARMLLGGLLRAHLADDLADKVFHFGLAQEYFAVREGEQ